MKIIAYKQDYVTATLKTLRNCNKLCTAYGVDFYYAPDKNDDRLTNYYYHIGGTVDLVDSVHFSRWESPETIKQMILNQITKERIVSLTPNAQTKLNQIKEAIKASTWTSNGDALFCELAGDFETAEKVRKNRAEYLAKKQQKEREEAEQQERERIAEEQEKAQKRLEKIAKAKALILSEQYITAEEFELVAEDCKIKLPIKLLGWLREYCGKIQIKKHTEQLPAGVEWTYKYDSNYTYKQKGHKSNSIFKYADMIAEYLGL